MIIKSVISLVYMLSLSLISYAQSFFTVIDDDAESAEAILSIKRVADRRGIKISYAVVAQRLQQDEKIVELLLEFQKEGHHICNHSLTHSSGVWKIPCKADIETELKRSEKILDSLGFKDHSYLIYPFGRFSQSTYTWLIPLVSHRFKMAFESRGYGNKVEETNKYAIKRLPLRRHDSRLIVRCLIDETVKKHGWIVFYTHSGNSRDFSEEMLEEIITYCQDKGMKCLTVKEAEDMKLGLLDGVCVKEWTLIDEFSYLLYLHIEWVVFSLIIIGVVISCWIRFR